MRSLRPTAALLVLTGLLATSCSAERDVDPPAPDRAAPAPASPTSSATPSPTTSTAAVGATMTIRDFAYVLPPSVPAGAQVTVVNEDREAHTVTVDRGAVRLTVLPGATAVFPAPAQPGSYPVTCDLHGGMDAVLVVV